MAEDSDTFEYGSNLMIWIWRISVVLVVVIYIYVFTIGYLSKNMDISDLELNSFKNRILFSPNCLAYKDQTVHPGIIDFLKFDGDRLSRCFQKNNFNFQLKLLDLDGEEIKSVQSSPQKVELAPLCSSLSNIKCSQTKEYILIQDSNGGMPAVLDIVVIKNV